MKYHAVDSDIYEGIPAHPASPAAPTQPGKNMNGWADESPES